MKTVKQRAMTLNRGISQKINHQSPTPEVERGKNLVMLVILSTGIHLWLSWPASLSESLLQPQRDYALGKVVFRDIVELSREIQRSNGVQGVVELIDQRCACPKELLVVGATERRECLVAIARCEIERRDRSKPAAPVQCSTYRPVELARNFNVLCFVIGNAIKDISAALAMHGQIETAQKKCRVLKTKVEVTQRE
jgi:hypothetical protein